MEKKRIYLYVITTFILTFAAEIFIIYPLYRQQGAQAAGMTGLLKTVMMFLPAVCVIITCLVTKDFKGIWIKPNGKKSVKYFFAGYFLPSVFTMLGAVVYFLVFPGEFDPGSGYLWAVLANAGVTPTDAIVNVTLISNVAAGIFLSGLINFIPALGEELGWRGYLLPKLMKFFSPGAAILISGTVWGLWHAPLIAMGHNYGTGYPGYPVAGILAMCVFCIMLGSFLSYLTIRTKSCLPAAVGHGAFNGIASLAIVFSDGKTNFNPFIGPVPTGILGGCILILAAVYCIVRLQCQNKKDGEDRPGLRKKMAAGGAMLLCLLTLGGCGVGKELSDSFSEDEIKTYSEETITHLNERDFEAVEEMVSEQYQDKLSKDVLEEAITPQLDKLGEFIKFESETVVGGGDSKEGIDMAVAFVTCRYEEGTAVYTLSFDTEYKLVGIYIK